MIIPLLIGDPASFNWVMKLPVGQQHSFASATQALCSEVPYLNHSAVPPHEWVYPDHSQTYIHKVYVQMQW